MKNVQFIVLQYYLYIFILWCRVLFDIYYVLATLQVILVKLLMWSW